MLATSGLSTYFRKFIWNVSVRDFLYLTITTKLEYKNYKNPYLALFDAYFYLRCLRSVGTLQREIKPQSRR